MAITNNAIGAIPRLLSIREAAALLGVSVWTVRDLVARGALPAVRPPTMRRVFIDRHDLDRAVAQWKECAAA